MRNTLIIAACALLLGSTSLAAQVTPRGQGMSYSWIEGGFSRINIDPGGPFSSVNENGFNFRGSAQVSDNLYLIGAWDRWEVLNSDTDLIKAGLGFRSALGPELDWFAEGSWTRINIDNFGSQNGGRFDLGLRRWVSERFELRGFGGYNFDGPEGDSFVFGGDALFSFTPLAGISLGVESYEFDVNVFRANLRLSF